MCGDDRTRLHHEGPEPSAAMMMYAGAVDTPMPGMMQVTISMAAASSSKVAARERSDDVDGLVADAGQADDFDDDTLQRPVGETIMAFLAGKFQRAAEQRLKISGNVSEPSSESC